MRRLMVLVALSTVVMCACSESALSTGAALVAPAAPAPTGATVSTAAPAEPLTRSAALAQAQAGYRFTFEAALIGVPELPAGLSVTGSGTVDQQGNRSSVLLDVHALRDLLVASGEVSASDIDPFLVDGRIELAQDGSTVYIRMPALAQRLGSSRQWVSMTIPTADPAAASPAVPGALGALGGIGGGVTAPADYLAQLRNLDASAHEAGTEVVRGASTTRYSGTLDLRALMGAQMTPAQAADLHSMMPFLDAFKLPFDVWVDADGLPRRFVLTLKLDSFMAGAAPRPTPVAAQPAPSLTFTYDLFDFGTAGAVTLPAADEVTVVDPRQLEALR